MGSTSVEWLSYFIMIFSAHMLTLNSVSSEMLSLEMIKSKSFNVAVVNMKFQDI